MTDLTTVNNSANSDILDYRYTRRLNPDPSGGYTATIHEFPGCIADGDTAEDALRNLDSTALSWLESAKFHGYKISPPVDFSGASGKIALRISRRIHQQAAERAELEGVSLNQFISVAIASYLGQRDAMQECKTALIKELQINLKGFAHVVFGFSKMNTYRNDAKNIYVHDLITKDIPFDSSQNMISIPANLSEVAYGN